MKQKENECIVGPKSKDNYKNHENLENKSQSKEFKKGKNQKTKGMSGDLQTEKGTLEGRTAPSQDLPALHQASCMDCSEFQGTSPFLKRKKLILKQMRFYTSKISNFFLRCKPSMKQQDFTLISHGSFHIYLPNQSLSSFRQGDFILVLFLLILFYFYFLFPQQPYSVNARVET